MTAGIIILFVGAITSGIVARVALLSHRGGWLIEDEIRKSDTTALLDLVGHASLIVAIIISFLLFAWWLPIILFVLGWWIIAPIIVTRNSYPTLYSSQRLLSSITLICSIAIIALYFLG